MRFCQDHWDRLRAAIEERGLGDLVAPDGETAALQVKDQLERGQRDAEDAVTPTNFDPLMGAHWAIVNNAMSTIQQAGGNPLYLMGGPDAGEDPVDAPGYEGRTWPRCPLCYVNLAHEISCTDPRCTLDRTAGYDWMIDRAADDAAEQARELSERRGPAA